MKSCPKCGAENRQNASECRLCATPLKEPVAVQPVIAVKEPGGQTICPACTAANEPEWIFCMQCGKRLPGHEPKSAAPVVPPPEASVTPQLSAGVKCGQCGEINSTTGFYCSACGALLSADSGEIKGPLRKAVVQLITEGGQVGEIHTIDRTETVIGRVDGDLIFPHDGYMSSRHARIVERDGRYILLDQSSRNGTFVRIKGEVELQPGDMFLVGKQLFRFEK